MSRGQRLGVRVATAVVVLSQLAQSRMKEGAGEILRIRGERVVRVVPTDGGVEVNCPLPRRSRLRGLPV